MPVLFQINDTDSDQILKDKLRKIFDHITKRLDSADKTTEIVERVVTTSEFGGGSSSLINHASTHEDDGTDEIDVTDLSGLLADEQTPIDHDHSGDAGDGGKLDWDNVWTDAVHSHASNEEGGVIVGGTDTQVQFNDGGSVLGGAAEVKWNKTEKCLKIGDAYTPSVNELLSVIRTAINTTTDFNGVFFSFKKTDGITAAADEFIGFEVDAYIEDADQTHGHLIPLILRSGLSAGTIAANKNLYGLDIEIETAVGSTLGGDAIGLNIGAENLIAGTVSGSIVGLNISLPSPAPRIENTTPSDADGARVVILDFRGRQSGDELSTLARIKVQHDGTGDDQKGDLIFGTNDGNDADSPTERLKIDSAGKITITNEISGCSGLNIVCNNNEVVCHNNEVVFA